MSIFTLIVHRQKPKTECSHIPATQFKKEKKNKFPSEVKSQHIPFISHTLKACGSLSRNNKWSFSTWEGVDSVQASLFLPKQMGFHIQQVELCNLEWGMSLDKTPLSKCSDWGHRELPPYCTWLGGPWSLWDSCHSDLHWVQHLPQRKTLEYPLGM